MAKKRAAAKSEKPNATAKRAAEKESQRAAKKAMPSAAENAMPNAAKKAMPAKAGKRATTRSVRKTKSVVAEEQPISQARERFEQLIQTERDADDRLHRERLRAEEVFERHRDRLMGLPMVNGVHVGYRRRKDEIVLPLEVCIRIHLSVCKYPKGDARIAHPIESEIEGVPVDILTRRYSIVGNPTSGELLSANTVAGNDPANNDVSDPILGGVSISRQGSNNFGTLGIPAFLGRKQVFVTNKHVVGEVDGTNSLAIVQPGATNAESIGEISKSRPPIRDASLDAAIVESDFSRSAKVRLRDFAGGIRPESLVTGNVVTSLTAFKIGARTDAEIHGRVQATNASVFIEGFGDMHGQLIVVPLDASQTLIRKGDSGSVLVQRIDDKMLQVIGLCHAVATDGALIACHWSDVEKRFGIRLFKI
jgi:hypothetical protein